MSITLQQGLFNFEINDLDFGREHFIFDYSKVDPKYHASSTPDDELILYKGALRGFNEKGFLSNALHYKKFDHLFDMKQLVENGTDEEIYRLIDNHTSYYYYTPFLSATRNPEGAQVHAPTDQYARKEEKTIYRLKIKSNRCILNPYDTWNCGEAKEFLILGLIYPDEISAVKILNDDDHSELLTQERRIDIVKWFPDRKSKNTSVKDENNWMQL